LTSLTKLALDFKQKKLSSSKLLKQTKNALDTAKSLHRKSASGINSIQRRVNSFRSELEGVTRDLEHYLAQKESIQRLKAAAEERLADLKVEKKNIEQQISSATGEAKEQLALTLDTTSEQITDLRSQLMNRNFTMKKIEKVIAEYSDKKSKLFGQIKNTLQSRPQLMDLIKSSDRDVSRLDSRLNSVIKQENAAQKNLSKVISRLNELNTKKQEMRKNLQRKRISEAKRKAAQEKQIIVMARKLASKMAAAKRKAPKRKAAKRKAPKRKAAKRKAPKRKAAKRKAPKRKAAKKRKR